MTRGSLFVAWLGRFKRMGVTTLSVQVAFGLFIVLFAARELGPRMKVS